jgi:hypothetical protein
VYVVAMVVAGIVVAHLGGDGSTVTVADALAGFAAGGAAVLALVTLLRLRSVVEAEMKEGKRSFLGAIWSTNNALARLELFAVNQASSSLDTSQIHL